MKHHAELTIAVCAAVATASLAAHAACPADDYESCGEGCYRACDCSFGKVAATLAVVAPGAEIQVPAGTCTWAGTLAVDRGMTLRGAGIGATVIVHGVADGYLLEYDPADWDANLPFRLSGFSFDMQDRSLLELGRGGMSPPFQRQTRIRIDHNRFFNAPSMGAQAIWNHSGTFGVVDNCVFDDVAYPIRSDAGVGDSSWWDSFTFGLGAPDDNLYFEDNVLGGVSAGIVSDCQYSGRYAFRYNTIATTADSYPLFDMHGNQYSSNPGASMWSCFGAELYGNRIEAGSHDVNLLDQRGGKAVVFYNRIATSSPNSSPAFIKVREEQDDALCPTTSSQPQHVSDSFYWNNRANGEIVPTSDDLRTTGVHDGPSGSATLSDSSASFPYADCYVGDYLHNLADGSKCRVTASTTTTAACALEGGVENDWDSGDGYTIENDCCRAIAADSEYFYDNPEFAAEPTSGIGCGTLAERPTTCSPGVAYWATDQSCGDVAEASAGAAPSAPLAGTLYQCTGAGTWVVHYVPYTYPHPLRQEAVATCGELGGSCCIAGESCHEGDFVNSTDCGISCCAEGTCAPSCVDRDLDGYGSPASPLCAQPEADCNDGDGAVSPGAAEVCTNGVDDDCSGLADADDPACAGSSSAAESEGDCGCRAAGGRGGLGAGSVGCVALAFGLRRRAGSTRAHGRGCVSRRARAAYDPKRRAS